MMVRSTYHVLFLCLVLLIVPGHRADAAELIMFEQDGCEWCEIWNQEIGVLYHKTAEGKRAPLRRLDIHDDLPPEIDGRILPARFTPTFVLMEDGVEVGRIQGYIGEYQFWGLLSELMEKLTVVEKNTNG